MKPGIIEHTVQTNKTKHETTLQLISLSHQVNTLFCLIAAKRKKGRRKQRERERERTRRMSEKETTDFGRAVATSLCIKSKDKVIRQH